MDFALNNLQGLICHKTQQTKPKYGELAKMLDCDIVVGSNYFRAFTFTFGVIL